jgi:hypothetical protein
MVYMQCIYISGRIGRQGVVDKSPCYLKPNLKSKIPVYVKSQTLVTIARGFLRLQRTNVEDSSELVK